MVILATSSNQVKSVTYTETQLQDRIGKKYNTRQYNIKTFRTYKWLISDYDRYGILRPSYSGPAPKKIILACPSHLPPYSLQQMLSL